MTSCNRGAIVLSWAWRGAQGVNIYNTDICATPSTQIYNHIVCWHIVVKAIADGARVLVLYSSTFRNLG